MSIPDFRTQAGHDVSNIHYDQAQKKTTADVKIGEKVFVVTISNREIKTGELQNVLQQRVDQLALLHFRYGAQEAKIQWRPESHTVTVVKAQESVEHNLQSDFQNLDKAIARNDNLKKNSMHAQNSALGLVNVAKERKADTQKALFTIASGTTKLPKEARAAVIKKQMENVKKYDVEIQKQTALAEKHRAKIAELTNENGRLKAMRHGATLLGMPTAAPAPPPAQPPPAAAAPAAKAAAKPLPPLPPKPKPPTAETTPPLPPPPLMPGAHRKASRQPESPPISPLPPGVIQKVNEKPEPPEAKA